MNKLIQTDSYKVSHSQMYNKDMNLMFDYVEARRGGKQGYSVFFGLQMFIKEFLMKPFSQEDIDEAAVFYAMHFGTDVVFDKEMFQYILDEHAGFFPVLIKAVPEGTKVPEGNVLCTFESTDAKCASVVSFLETMATSYIWYGTTVATNSYAMKQVIQRYADMTAVEFDISFSLHDFGARGVAPGGQRLGSAAHLVNFQGSDSLEGVYATQKYYGVAEGLPAYSIPATEHSVMCSEGRWGEMVVAERVFDAFASDGGIIAMVNDSYDMVAHIDNFSKIFKAKYQSTGVRWVTRPDSGVPSESVVLCLRMLWERFGGTKNSKGYKVLDPSVRVIQGDGIDLDSLGDVLRAVTANGFSTENVAFGSGGGLLQKVNRDDLRFAMKASYIEVAGKGRDVYKDPATQDGNYSKKSKAGRLSLYNFGEGYITEPYDGDLEEFEVLKPVYRNGEERVQYTLDEVRENTLT